MSSVKLYVYDLSRGFARAMSAQMLGRQIDGIWHTSVVVHGIEVFYGQGIMITAPGQSHHGTPSEVIDMGETSIDEETFHEYINQLRDHYTADKYHLLEFNCNSFTNDCIGFLTGGKIPGHIADLPSDFLSTPLGQALRPTIDSMFSPTGMPPPSSQSQPPQAVSSALNSIVAQATTSPQASAASTITAPLQICTNPSSLRSIMERHRATVVFFTSATCPPCRVIEPVFEDLAYGKASAGVAFVKVDLGVGMGRDVASQYSVRATPTFIFFVDGNKIAEVKGADVPDLKANVDFMIFQAFPPHPHTLLDLPTVRAISLQPILYRQVPNVKGALDKLNALIDASKSQFDKGALKSSISNSFGAYLNQKDATVSPTLVSQCISVTQLASANLVAADMFPLADFWRISLLDPKFNQYILTETSTTEPFETILNELLVVFEDPSTSPSNPRNFFVTVLRMLSNAFSLKEMARHILSPSLRDLVTRTLVQSLLHPDSAVRIGAAGLAFNIAAHYQTPLIEFHRNGVKGDPSPDVDVDADWEVELVSALVEALASETQSEEVVHRLTAALALLLHFTSSYQEQLLPLLEVLQVKDTLLSKLENDGFGGKKIEKEDVRKLIAEVANKLCA